MKENKGKSKEKTYLDLAGYYRIHINLVRRIIARARHKDFSVHKSTTHKNALKGFLRYVKAERRIYETIEKRRKRNAICRYEKTQAGEMVHIDLHKVKNIAGENPQKKKYLASVIDDATRISYTRVLSDKKAKTVSIFFKNAYTWFRRRGITIQSCMSDNGLEFTTHHRGARENHSFEIILKKLSVKHVYTRVRSPQTNGKVERFWRIFHEQFFSTRIFTSQCDFHKSLQEWLFFYNNKRPHGGIGYITPMEKYNMLLKTASTSI